MRSRTNLTLVSLLVVLTATGWCQDSALYSSTVPVSAPALAYQTANPIYQYYMSPGTDNQLIMKVNIWGEVERPGLLEVPDRTDLLSVLSLAGGPKDGAKLSKVKIIRGFNGEKKSWEVNLKEVVKSGSLDQVPTLQPGDTVIVPKGGFRAFSKILTVAYNLAIVVTASALIFK